MVSYILPLTLFPRPHTARELSALGMAFCLYYLNLALSPFCCIIDFIRGHFWTAVLKLLYNCSHNEVVYFQASDTTRNSTILFSRGCLKRSTVSQARTPKARPTALKSRVSHLNISCTLVLWSATVQDYHKQYF